jgi:hypothetical protein
MKRTVSILLVVCFLWNPLGVAAVRGKSARYVGGTIAAFKEAVNGKWDLDEKAAVFTAEKGAGQVTIPFDKIDTLEYGQKVGRRLGAATAGAFIVSPVFLFLLFSKKRKHFLSIGFTDEEGKKQGAVFELAKGIVKESLTTLEAKSGKKVEYESDDAKKFAQKQ